MYLEQLQQRFPHTGEKQVLVTEVTRMTGGQVCVAGLDIHSGEMVRPLRDRCQTFAAVVCPASDRRLPRNSAPA